MTRSRTTSPQHGSGDGAAGPAGGSGRLPTFLVIGAQKAGTTWLARNLAQHPDVYLYPREIHYFNHADRHRRGLGWYRAHFRAASDQQAVGEKTPSYLWVTDRTYRTHPPGVHRRVHAALPDARLVAILREPVARAVSSLRHHVRAGRISPRLDVDELLAGRYRHLAEEQGVIDMGRYMRGIDAYLELYPRSQLLVLIYEEDVREDPAGGLRRVCRFLGVPPDHRFEDPGAAVARHRPSVLGSYLRRHLPATRRLGIPQVLDRWLPAYRSDPRPETLERLHRLYAPDNERLYEFLGRVPAGWREPQ